MAGGWGKFRSKDILFLDVLVTTLSVAKTDDRWLSMGNGEITLSEQKNYSEENLSQWPFIYHHNSHVD